MGFSVPNKLQVMKPCRRGHTDGRNKHGQCVTCESTKWQRMPAQQRTKKYEANKKNCFDERHVNKYPVSTIERMMIRNYYKDAQLLTAETGIKHEVDHIIPTSRGGPHLPWNLQVLTATENKLKSDKI